MTALTTAAPPRRTLTLGLKSPPPPAARPAVALVSADAGCSPLGFPKALYERPAPRAVSDARSARPGKPTLPLPAKGMPLVTITFAGDVALPRVPDLRPFASPRVVFIVHGERKDGPNLLKWKLIAEVKGGLLNKIKDAIAERVAAGEAPPSIVLTGYLNAKGGLDQATINVQMPKEPERFRVREDYGNEGKTVRDLAAFLRATYPDVFGDTFRPLAVGIGAAIRERHPEWSLRVVDRFMAARCTRREYLTALADPTARRVDLDGAEGEETGQAHADGARDRLAALDRSLTAAKIRWHIKAAKATIVQPLAAFPAPEDRAALPDSLGVVEPVGRGAVVTAHLTAKALAKAVERARGGGGAMELRGLLGPGAQVLSPELRWTDA